MTTGPKTVILANAGIQVLLALRDGSRNLDPRFREDDGFMVSDIESGVMQ